MMKELNSTEVQEVSGAGIFSDAGLSLGQSIGAIVDASIGKGNAGATTGASLGQSIGAIIDNSLNFWASIFSKK